MIDAYRYSWFKQNGFVEWTNKLIAQVHSTLYLWMGFEGWGSVVHLEVVHLVCELRHCLTSLADSQKSAELDISAETRPAHE